MKRQAIRTAGLAFGITLAAGVCSANPTPVSEDTDADCLMSIAAYRSGLPGISATEAKSTRDQVVETTHMFRDVVNAARKSYQCYDTAIAMNLTEEERDGIRLGLQETGRIFAMLQTEYEQAIDALSGKLLSGMTPAAGAGASPSGAGTLDDQGMELLFESYMILEKSQELAKQYAGRMK